MFVREEGVRREGKERGRHCEDLFHRQYVPVRFVVFSFSVSRSEVHDTTALLKTEGGETRIHLSTLHMFPILRDQCTYATVLRVGNVVSRHFWNDMKNVFEYAGWVGPC